jgi:hypothetical protein
MLDQIRDGDILVVWKLDRLARSTRDLLEGAGGKLQSSSERWVDTTFQRPLSKNSGSY